MARIKISLVDSDPTEERIRVELMQPGTFDPEGGSDIPGPDEPVAGFQALQIQWGNSVELPVPPVDQYYKVTKI